MTIKFTDKFKFSPAFTIIELLIVIVIVGVLVAITAVSYTGIVKNAEISAISSSAKNIESEVEVFMVKKGVYPTSISACPTPGPTEMCLKAPNNVTMQYSYFPKGVRTHDGGYQTSIISDRGFYELTLLGQQEFLYASHGETTSPYSSEFMQYADFAPLINKYGLKKYNLDFKARSKSTANKNMVNVYFQNGSNARHWFLIGVTLTEKEEPYKISFTPTLSMPDIERSILACYGGYYSGYIPVISDVRFYLAR